MAHIAHAQESDLPPFEKIYVSPNDVFCTPYGSYYCSPSGAYEPIRKISCDNEGTYIIKIIRQCPTCGRYHFGKDTVSENGFNCVIDPPLPTSNTYDWPPGRACLPES